MMRLFCLLGVISWLPFINCQDTHPFCCFWASKGFCDSNPVYMRTECQKSCGTIGCSKANVQFCKRVKVSTDGCPYSGPVIPVESQDKNSGMDLNLNCCMWASKGQCNLNQVYMRTNCQKSCGTPGCTVENAYRCHVTLNIKGCTFFGNGKIVKPQKKRKTTHQQHFAVRNNPEVFRRPQVEIIAQNSASSTLENEIQERLDRILEKLAVLKQNILKPVQKLPKNNKAVVTNTKNFQEPRISKKSEEVGKVLQRLLTKEEENLFFRCKNMYSRMFSSFSSNGKPLIESLTLRSVRLHLKCQNLYDDVFA